MAQTQDNEAHVKSAPLTYQVVERGYLGHLFVVAAFDRPEDAEAFAGLASNRRARRDPAWLAVEEMGRKLQRAAHVTDELAGRDA